MEHKCLHACTPENRPQVESFSLRSTGEESLLVRQKQAHETREREREGTALHEVCCRAMLKIHTKFFFGGGGGSTSDSCYIKLDF